ncbi:MAG TPA: DPP IV N-terminal domain-containing protein [Bacteroidia bacterium]|nr:DPP IV N-terminal domain-containing protein [Bacteroidia bacterium]
MKKFIVPTLAFIFGIYTSGFSQQKMLTMDDVVLKSKTSLAPENIEQLKWIVSGDAFSYIKTSGKELQIVQSAPSGSEKIITTRTQINSLISPLRKDTLLTIPEITWTSPETFAFDYKEYTYEFSSKSQNLSKICRLPGSEMENSDKFSPAGPIACTLDNNLWVFTGNDSIRITNESDPGIVCGKSVHRDEFGIHKGTYWSPGGHLLAFYRMDETMVTQYPIVNIDEAPATAKFIRYPVAGDPSHHVTIGVYNMQTGSTVFLKTGEPAEQYLTNIAWSPDEKYVYVAVLNRGQDHLKMNRYNAATGAFEATLFEETDPKYVQPLNPIEFAGDSKFIWQSRRDGYNHLYLYSSSGELISQLTTGKWEVTNFLGFNSSASKAFFEATAVKPINRDIYSVDLKSKQITRISSGDGVHKGNVSKSGKYVLDEFTGPGIPRNIDLISGSGKTVRKLLVAGNPLSDYMPVDVSIFTIKNQNGDSLYCRMIKPANMVAGKKYASIVYVYGGPNVQLITNTWTAGTDLWAYYMAERGFVVFTMDNRGSDNRGKEFEQATFRELGKVEREDQLEGIKYLINQNFIDRNKMGVYGWSFGGFMSATLMTRNPGIFRAAVAGGPVIDWRLYEVMYTERYMDTPAENPQGYFESSLLNYVGDLKGKMLMIHGTYDNVVIWQHTLLYLREAVRKNVQMDYFVYPGHEHNVKGKDRVHLLNKISQYFFDNLN